MGGSAPQMQAGINQFDQNLSAMPQSSQSVAYLSGIPTLLNMIGGNTNYYMPPYMQNQSQSAPQPQTQPTNSTPPSSGIGSWTDSSGNTVIGSAPFTPQTTQNSQAQSQQQSPIWTTGSNQNSQSGMLGSGPPSPFSLFGGWGQQNWW